MKVRHLLILSCINCFGLLLAITLLSLLSATSRIAHAAGPWYVTSDGSDSNPCTSSSLPCGTINGAIGKASPGDTIYIAAGVYTGTTNDIVHINKDIILSGGWDITFSTQEGNSIVDGENARRGILVDGAITSSIDHFIIQGGASVDGGGIFINGALSLENCSILSNTVSDEGGGVFIQNGGSLTLNQSSVANNKANSGGGVFSAWGTLNVNNSTFQNNFANGGGGINNLGGSVSLNSSTISANEMGSMGGGGIRNEGGIVVLQNTIIAANSGGYGPDCNGSFSSHGYNVIGDTSECTFSSASGDLLDVNPGLLTMPLGWPAYFALFPNSPAIDGGNPAGCSDHEGTLLSVDQRGSARSIDGDADGSVFCDIGAYEFDPANPEAHQVFLSMILRNACSQFYDDFSNPNSGWDVVNNDYEHTEYINGEYRVAPKQIDYTYYYPAPTCSRGNYVVESDARWASTPGGSYGILFGALGDFSRFYTFDIDSEWQVFSAWRRDPSGWTEIVPWSYSSAINAGTSTNHLKLTRDGTQITLEVNGVVFGTWSDSNLTGSTYVGVMAYPYYEQKGYDVRFDNFSVK